MPSARSNDSKKKRSDQEGKMSSAKDNDLKKRRQDMIVGVAENSPALNGVKKYIVQYAPLMAQALVFVELTVFPMMTVAFQKGELGWNILKPHVTGNNMEDFVPCICGFALCFFGGCFPLLIASVEAFRLVGFTGMKTAILALYQEVQKALEANKKDDDEDKDNNGIKDVLEMAPSQLVMHKGYIILKVVDPNKVSEALKSISSGIIAVVASIKVTFARVLTLGTTLGDALKKQVDRSGVPMIKHFFPEETHKWIPVVVDVLCKLVAIFIAMSLQRVISAFHSAIRGGRMVGEYGVKYGKRMGYPVVKDFDPHTSQLDEMVGYAFAALGFLFQCYMAFSLMFPFNLVFLPVRIAEGLLGTLVMWI